MKKLFTWPTKTLESGRVVKIGLDENGVQILKATWCDFDFEQLKAEPVMPPKTKVIYEGKYDNNTSKIIIKRNSNPILILNIYGFPVCCGMRQFGNIETYDDNFTEDIKEDDFKKVLDKSVKEMLRSYSNDENNQCITFVITLRDDHTYLADSFNRTGDFEKVKKFINRNSANLLTLWYSTN